MKLWEFEKAVKTDGDVWLDVSDFSIMVMTKVQEGDNIEFTQAGDDVILAEIIRNEIYAFHLFPIASKRSVKVVDAIFAYAKTPVNQRADGYKVAKVRHDNPESTYHGLNLYVDDFVFEELIDGKISIKAELTTQKAKAKFIDEYDASVGAIGFLKLDYEDA